jgi:hypothetical protein
MMPRRLVLRLYPWSFVAFNRSQSGYRAEVEGRFPNMPRRLVLRCARRRGRRRGRRRTPRAATLCRPGRHQNNWRLHPLE